MRVVVVGLGVQGRKRLRVAGDDVVASVDPVAPGADHRELKEVPLDAYDAALVCVPDAAKLELLDWLLDHGKHVLVEKPLVCAEDTAIERLAVLAQRRSVVCYTAYNHRFEPHFVGMRGVIESGRLGRIYQARLFYGNGTARDVRGSPWRDRGGGVLPDLGSHLLDTVLFWFGERREDFRLEAAHRFENRAFDHAVLSAQGHPVLQLEASLLSWRNQLSVDVYGEHGSAHIDSLCKWGPSTLTVRTRVLPSGRPPENSTTLVQPDPTWDLEYRDFVRRCRETGEGNLENDLWINRVLNRLQAQAAPPEAS